MLATHPDPTVDHVLKTWAPRMIVQGIDYNDLMTTAARIRTFGVGSGPSLPRRRQSRFFPNTTWVPVGTGVRLDSR